MTAEAPPRPEDCIERSLARRKALEDEAAELVRQVSCVNNFVVLEEGHWTQVYLPDGSEVTVHARRAGVPRVIISGGAEVAFQPRPASRRADLAPGEIEFL